MGTGTRYELRSPHQLRQASEIKQNIDRSNLMVVPMRLVAPSSCSSLGGIRAVFCEPHRDIHRTRGDHIPADTDQIGGSTGCMVFLTNCEPLRRNLGLCRPTGASSTTVGPATLGRRRQMCDRFAKIRIVFGKMCDGWACPRVRYMGRGEEGRQREGGGQNGRITCSFTSANKQRTKCGATLATGFGAG